ncbi:AP endonuclease [Lophium mytilinum]|uniref:Apurinic-apyrimidinic endonuclease 1 n=1 Tax=Lophium mytilinum TaxID=390894 RepID=A0A6A6QSH8_9PEZI|nr:AP endonuclease [Lophium mytilinum]
MLRRHSPDPLSTPSTGNPPETAKVKTTVKRTVKKTVETVVETPVEVTGKGKKRKAAATPTQPAKRARKAVDTKAAAQGKDLEASPETTPKKVRKTKAKASVANKSAANESASPNNEEPNGNVKPKTPVKRKTTSKKAVETMPLAARTVGSKLLVGAHVSAAGGVHNTIANCVRIGGNAFALFLKSQRKWNNPPLSEEHLTLFHGACKTHKIEPSKTAVPHGSYLVNLAHTDADRTTQAYDCFLDDLNRCHRLGIKLYNFHPGNSASSTREDAIAHIASNLNRAHANETSGSVITVLETMATLGNTVGGTFEDLAAIIALITDKSRVGICIDTCHIFAAGYDLRSPEAFKATMEKFDQTVGFKYLKALHVNDSKAPFASYRDLHANIGTGFLGLRAFHNLVNEPRLWGLPMVLETPIEVVTANGKKSEDQGIYAREIKLLESLVGMDLESKEFLDLEKDLQIQGANERDRVQDQVTRKEAKAVKGGQKGKGKKTKKVAPSDEEDSNGSE